MSAHPHSRHHRRRYRRRRCGSVHLTEGTTVKHRPPLWLRVLLAVGIITTRLPASAHAGTPTSQPTTVTQQGRNWGHSVKPATGQPVRRPTVPGSMHEVLAFQTSCRTLLYSDG